MVFWSLVFCHHIAYHILNSLVVVDCPSIRTPAKVSLAAQILLRFNLRTVADSDRSYGGRTTQPSPTAQGRSSSRTRRSDADMPSELLQRASHRCVASSSACLAVTRRCSGSRPRTRERAFSVRIPRSLAACASAPPADGRFARPLTSSGLSRIGLSQFPKPRLNQGPAPGAAAVRKATQHDLPT